MLSPTSYRPPEGHQVKEKISGLRCFDPIDVILPAIHLQVRANLRRPPHRLLICRPHEGHNTEELRVGRVKPGPAVDNVTVDRAKRYDVELGQAGSKPTNKIPSLGRDSRLTYKNFPSNPSLPFYSLLIYKFPSISPYFQQFLLPLFQQMERVNPGKCYKVDCFFNLSYPSISSFLPSPATFLTPCRVGQRRRLNMWCFL